MTAKEWKGNLKNENFDLNGNLKIGNKTFSVIAAIHVTENEDGQQVISGTIHSKFKTFEIAPPRLWGGIGARVSDDLDLIFQIQPSKTLGSSSLMSQK